MQLKKKIVLILIFPLRMNVYVKYHVSGGEELIILNCSRRNANS